LIQFPEEPVQQDRWRKIAQALGTRTAKQVGTAARTASMLHAVL